MRLTTSNIKFVKVLEKNGKPYSWHVAMKSNMLCDSRNFVNHINGKTTADVEYPSSMLPKVVQKFIESKTIEMVRCHEEYAEYIYR